jgi:hypothetical protein
MKVIKNVSPISNDLLLMMILLISYNIDRHISQINITILSVKTYTFDTKILTVYKY